MISRTFRKATFAFLGAVAMSSPAIADDWFDRAQRAIRPQDIPPFVPPRIPGWRPGDLNIPQPGPRPPQIPQRPYYPVGPGPRPNPVGPGAGPGPLPPVGPRPGPNFPPPGVPEGGMVPDARVGATIVIDNQSDGLVQFDIDGQHFQLPPFTSQSFASNAPYPDRMTFPNGIGEVRDVFLPQGTTYAKFIHEPNNAYELYW